MLKTLTFVISAENHPDLLARTVMLFHRMAIPIHALTMRRPTDGSNLRMEVEVVADRDQSQRISAQLAKLIHVAWVETRKPETSPGRGTRYALVRTP
jgi:acetolactate synthase small subunit